jgi:uncharacterized protein (TIGR03086 family)
VNAALDDAVELMERSLAYTRVALADVDDAVLGRPTPCSAWTLDALLDHMGDALDAFTEAAVGWVDVRRPAPAPNRVTALQDRACALLGAWAQAAPEAVTVGDRTVPASLVVATAALEITVHGWDVGRATGRGTPIPSRLARDLLPVARTVVTPADRGVRFAAERPAAGSAYDARLLAFLGRDLTGPAGKIRSNPGTGPAAAS